MLEKFQTGEKIQDSLEPATIRFMHIEDACL